MNRKQANGTIVQLDVFVWILSERKTLVEPRTIATDTVPHRLTKSTMTARCAFIEYQISRTVAIRNCSSQASAVLKSLNIAQITQSIEKAATTWFEVTYPNSELFCA